MKKNCFEAGQATWGAFLDFELFYLILAENNVFLNGAGVSRTGVGTGSTVVMTGCTNFSMSSYFGTNNMYLNGFSENKGN